MAKLVYDEKSLVDGQIYKYDKFIHSRINRYTGAGRTHVTYFNINDTETTDSLGMGTHYQILGTDSPLRYNKIEDMFLIEVTPISDEDSNVSSSTVRNIDISGEAYIIPGTVMPKENDFFIINHIHMSHIFRVTQVSQDGLNTDGSYKIAYSLFSTNPNEINWVHKQTVGEYKLDLQSIGGTDLTPVIGKEDYELRSRLIKMVDDMIESYVCNFYDKTHNCFICHMNGRSLFDVCGNMFMAKHGIMIQDNSNGNIVLNENKLGYSRIDMWYQKSPYKWIERDAPLRYVEPFKYHTDKGCYFVNSSFERYSTDVDVMIPNEPWCNKPDCELFFPLEVVDIFEHEFESRECNEKHCCQCEYCGTCIKHHKIPRHDYVSIIHDFIHGKLRSIHDLSLYTGDEMFGTDLRLEKYLWTPIVIYIIKQTLKIQ